MLVKDAMFIGEALLTVSNQRVLGLEPGARGQGLRGVKMQLKQSWGISAEQGQLAAMPTLMI